MTINFENSPGFTVVKDSAHLAELLNTQFEAVTDLDEAYSLCRDFGGMVWAVNPRTGKPTRATITTKANRFGEPTHRIVFGLKFENGHYDTFNEWDVRRGRILRIVG